MANIHCFGVGLVGSYVAAKLAESGHTVHAYDPKPFRVIGIPGVEVHQLENDENPLDLMLHMIMHQDGFEFNPFRDIVVNMLPGDVGHSSTTSLAELPSLPRRSAGYPSVVANQFSQSNTITSIKC